MDSNKIASVLEEAARLYKDEKVEWCNGSWVETPDSAVEDEIQARDLDVVAENTIMSACAEGALLRAAGFSWNVIDAFAGHAEVTGEREWLEQADREQADLYYAGRDALSHHLVTHTQERYVSPAALRFEEGYITVGPHKPVGVSIPSWNDTMEAQIVDRHYFRKGQPRLTPSEMAKTVVIDAMEATAKDLRNQGRV